MDDNLSNKSKEYLKNIEKELNILKENSLINAEEVNKQSEIISKINNDAEDINYNVKLSKWYLNLIDSTFGRIYEKLNKLPMLKKKSIEKPSLNKTKNLNSPLNSKSNDSKKR